MASLIDRDGLQVESPAASLAKGTLKVLVAKFVAALVGLGYTRKEIARELGRTEEWVSRSLKRANPDVEREE